MSKKLKIGNITFIAESKNILPGGILMGTEENHEGYAERAFTKMLNEVDNLSPKTNNGK